MLCDWIVPARSHRRCLSPSPLTGIENSQCVTTPEYRAATIRDVKAGVLIARYSGGRPNAKGDFSGIAKNSYYIEDGAIAYPISETMVSGNLASLLTNIVAISSERADFGSGIFPWIRVGGIGIS